MVQFSISHGELSKIWDDTNKTLNTANTKPNLVNGNLYVGCDATDKRAMLFADLNGIRYPFAASVKWSDILDAPKLVLENNFNVFKTTVENTYLKKDGDTATGNINFNKAILFNNKISLTYNTDSESLDFTFL